MRDDARRIPDILLERYRLGELDARRKKEMDDRLAADEGLRRRLAELERSDREILDRYPARDMARKFHERSKRRRPAIVFAWAGSAGAAAAALAAVFAFFIVPALKDGGDSRLKGADAPALIIYRQASPEAELLKDGSTVVVGDVIQLRYQARGKKFGVIFSIDGRGGFTPHFPLDPAQGTGLQSDEALVERGFRLDDAPGFEKFFFVVADTNIDAMEMYRLAAAAAAGVKPSDDPGLTLPAGYAYTAVRLVKGEWKP